jgi:hypothetical protein
MKIAKEVIISAPINDIWSWLCADAFMQNNVDEEPTCKSIRIPKLAATDPPRRLSFTTPALPSIKTIMELSEKGRRTCLRVTINGWEEIDPDKARHQMPQISLDWERKLGQIKKAVENSLRNRD